MPLDAHHAATNTHTANSAHGHPLTLNVRMPDGGWLAPTAVAGHRVVELLARFGLPVRDECRGRCACATCRVRIPLAWRDRLLPPGAEEAAVVSQLVDGDASTRLLCRLVMTPDLDGLEFELHWDALVPQTYWIAG